ncbi:TolC family outer membrane protein [Solimonas terrae]|uniref:TolC family outer membrane protein n=1 Tax=Solimonas terrae TaxID=1396819 RepID=A0A6M2BTH1_9GAMM|nr:TolC family outer membrane protein [Solimonas terrae]NGY05267.1 TolC family outer membrane protein [Solimonas terrae]
MSLTSKSLWSCCTAMLLGACLGSSASAQGATGSQAAASDLLTICNDALQFNPAYESARASYYAAKELVPQARGKLLPQVGLLGEYDWLRQHQDATYHGDFEIANRSYDTRFIVNGSDTFTRGLYGAQLTQALYRPQLFLGLSAAKLKGEQAELALTAAQDELLINVADSYFAVLAARDAAAFAHAETEALHEQFQHASSRSDAGLATLADVKAAEASYAIASVDEADARNTLLAAQMALEALTGRSYPSLKVLPPNVGLSAPQPMDEDAWVARAQTDNPAILAQKAGLEIARINRRASERARYPQVDLVGTASAIDNTGGVSGEVDGDDESIGVRLTMPIYSGGQVSSAIRQSEELEKKADADVRDTQATTIRNTRLAFLNTSTGLQRIAALKRAVEAASDAEDAARSGFDAGTRSNTDVLDAVEKRYGAERDYAAARYRLLVNSLRLKQLSGNLLTADLAQINRLLQPPQPASP